MRKSRFTEAQIIGMIKEQEFKRSAIDPVDQLQGRTGCRQRRCAVGTA